MIDKCRYCDEQGKRREEVLNEHGEHDVLCGEHFAMVLLVKLDECKGENSYPKAVAFRSRYSYLPEKEKVIIKECGVVKQTKRKKRRP
jgi:hypothetical protein